MWLISDWSTLTGIMIVLGWTMFCLIIKLLFY